MRNFGLLLKRGFRCYAKLLGKLFIEPLSRFGAKRYAFESLLDTITPGAYQVQKYDMLFSASDGRNIYSLFKEELK